VQSAEHWLGALGAGSGALATIATDGETYGHHHKFGDMALASVVEGAASRNLMLTNPARVIADHPDGAALTLVAPSAWSCAHGVERWRADCGCRMEPEKFPSQAWRAPLRESLEWLAGVLHERFEREGELLFGDPWHARDMLEGLPPSPLLVPAARTLLEMERNALRMFTSCGWFFDDLGGIETIQCLRYAARAIELTGDAAPALRAELERRMGVAESNEAAVGNGARLLRERVYPAILPAARIAAGHVATWLFPWRVSTEIDGAWEIVEGEDGVLQLTDRRTGQNAEADGRVYRDGDGVLAIEVRMAGGDPWRVELAELTESDRARVRAALTAALFPAELTDDLYALGAIGIPAVEGRILELLSGERELQQFEPSLMHLALDLLAVDSEPVPFDAQTRFAEWMEHGSAEARETLAPFAVRFGFSADAGRGALG
jgi:hypothetical protein